MGKVKKKELVKVVRIIGRTKNNRPTFIEFGYVENPSFNNDIYFMIHSAHKGGSGLWELRTDEALIFIQGLAMALNVKSGLKIERLVGDMK